MQSLVLTIALLLSGGPATEARTAVVPWPALLGYQPAAPGHLALGPGAAMPDGDGLWLFHAPSHALVRLDAEGAPVEQVAAAGFVHSPVVRADGTLAWVDLARRVVVLTGRDGRVTREVPLPAGLDLVRRVREIDGRLVLHTALQETFTVPGGDAPSLRAWFAARREGLLFAADRPAAQVVVSEGRALLRLHALPAGPTVGQARVTTLPLALPPDALAAEVLGPAPGEQARDDLIVVDARGRARARFALPARRTLSWPDTLFVGSTGEVVGLTPTDAGVERRTWRQP
jgi:hypothetical protein